MHLNHCVYLSTGPHWKLQRAASHFKPQTFPLSSPPASLRSLLRASLSLIPSPEACFHMWLILELGTRQRTSSESLQNKCTDVQPCEKLCNPHRGHRPPLTFLSVSLNTWQPYLRRGSPAPYSTVSFPLFPYITFLRPSLRTLVHLRISVCYIGRYFCSFHFKLDMVSITSKDNNENGRGFQLFYSLMTMEIPI